MRGPQHPHCTRAHQAGALLLVAVTFLLTRLLSAPPQPVPTSRSATPGPWPDLAPHHDHLRVYVYDEDEIDGLRALLRGRDHTVSAATCLKGQWGTQVRTQIPYWISSPPSQLTPTLGLKIICLIVATADVVLNCYFDLLQTWHSYFPMMVHFYKCGEK